MSKRSISIAASLVLGFLAYGRPAFAADVTGVLVDGACYTANKANTTNAHKDMGDTCAQDCAKKGNQVVLVTKAGEKYDVMPMGTLAGEKNAKLVPHMSHTVTLTGSVADGAKGKNKVIHASALKMVSQ
jgi:hypothetical protein